MLKKQNGLTLIALVITIIVMIILAGVSLSLTTGDNGVLNKAKLAKEETRAGQVKDVRDLWASDKKISDEIGVESEHLDNVMARLKKDGLLTDAEIDEIKDPDNVNKEIKIGTQTISFKYESSNTSSGSNQGGDNGLNPDGTINWEKIKADLPTNYSKYLTLAQAKNQTDVNIGIGTDGEVVNLDLWNYFVTDDGNGMSLGKGEVCAATIGYDEEDLIDNKVQGKMPQYIYIKSENKVYPVTMLQCTFYNLNVQEIPEIPTTVTSITEGAFRYCYGLTSIIIPSNVISIGREAFSGCGLTSVTIPSSVTSIGYSAFSGCTNLTSVIIPSSVTSIGNYAFSSCTGLTSVTIPSSVTSIGDQGFSSCSGLASIKVDGKNSIYDSRENCNAIIKTATNELVVGCKNTTIPSSVTSIGDNAFISCNSLTSVTIPSSVTSIGNYAFAYCSELTSVTIPSSVTSIGNNAFEYCYDLASITISSSVTSIGNYAFSSCTGLTSVTIPSSVTSIGYSAFSGCTKLGKVYFEQKATPSFGSNCFKKYSGVKTTFYFKNSTVANAFTTSHYNTAYGTISTSYSW